MTNKLTLKDREFADLWRGGPDELRGNAAAIYRHMHPKCKPATAETNGPAVLRKTQVKEYLDIKSGELSKKCDVDAEYVLRQSIRLHDRAMGDEPVPGETTIETNPETGQEVVIKTERRDYDPTTARHALQLIGQHKSVQAFSQTVEHNHTHTLENRLAARSKAIEKAAIKRNLELV